jgi:hypothetical protein
LGAGEEDSEAAGGSNHEVCRSSIRYASYRDATNEIESVLLRTVMTVESECNWLRRMLKCRTALGRYWEKLELRGSPSLKLKEKHPLTNDALLIASGRLREQC